MVEGMLSRILDDNIEFSIYLSLFEKVRNFFKALVKCLHPLFRLLVDFGRTGLKNQHLERSLGLYGRIDLLEDTTLGKESAKFWHKFRLILQTLQCYW